MFVQFSVRMEVPVRVWLCAARMGVRMSMEMKAVFAKLIQHTDSQHHQHYRNGEFEIFSDPIRNPKLEKNDEAAAESQRESVAGPPEEADPTASKKTLFPADECRYGDDMIWIRRVLQTQKETQAEDREKRGFHY
jgi:hypothetical protein